MRAIQAAHVAEHVEQEMRLNLRLQERQLLFAAGQPQRHAARQPLVEHDEGSQQQRGDDGQLEHMLQPRKREFRG
ncbi:MAG TPA: hypothetical protein VFR86_25255 [Burkholderiaceae bacterium]|nr:hypothetical protein [Burkholderiaceae bacterium]